MSIVRRDFVITEIQDYNKKVGKDALLQKYLKMVANPFAFYRGTNHLFWYDFSNGRGSKKFSTSKTKVWLQGDLHAYNFGTFVNDKGDFIYGLNDFDEGLIADYQYDVWRMAVSLLLIARENGKSDKNEERKLVSAFSKSYLKKIENLCNTNHQSKVVYTAKRAAQPLKGFMKKIDRKNTKSRKEMLAKWTKKGHFNLALDKLGKVSDRDRKIIIRAIQGKSGEKSQYRKTLKCLLKNEKAKYFKVVDVAERLLAGTGSLGTKRYYVLIEGRKSKGGDDVILDIKQQSAASAYPYLNEEDRKLYCFDNEAERTVEAYRALANRPNDHLGWVKLPKMGGNTPAGYYSVRERSPKKDSYPALIDDLKKSTKNMTLKNKTNFKNMCKQWGKILAISHARADNNANKARISYSFEKELSSVVQGQKRNFCKQVCATTQKYADQVGSDYEHFKAWFDTLPKKEL